ncbi:hypothetical protein [Nitratireductor sp. XY-223]|uniref:hypothetical protein n=1 Tax=Nitratireductor sp. XY-223 TaxID=2561926 RepID=UPI00145AB474|nr:hypothetical protein [Nitratireductor sp. XY-223]
MSEAVSFNLYFELNRTRPGAAASLPAFGPLIGADIFTYRVTFACRIVHRNVAMKAV